MYSFIEYNSNNDILISALSSLITYQPEQQSTKMKQKTHTQTQSHRNRIFIKFFSMKWILLMFSLNFTKEWEKDGRENGEEMERKFHMYLHICE